MARKAKPLLTDDPWALIEPLLPKHQPSSKGGRRPIDHRRVLEGILWILRSGARWQDLPDRYPSPGTCWRRLRNGKERCVCESMCVNRGVWIEVCESRCVNRCAWTDVCELRCGARFCPTSTKPGGLTGRRPLSTPAFSPQKRGPGVGKTKRGKGTKGMVVADGQGIPLGLRLASASPAEVTLLEETLDETIVQPQDRRRKRRQPKRRIADRADDSDAHRIRLAHRGIELICPHRRGRKRPAQQDGRSLRRYRKRWRVERVFAWLGNYRRLLIRRERNVMIYRAFLPLACILITIRPF